MVMEERNDIVIYQSEDGLITMEAMVDQINETIWASQRAMGLLENVFSKELLLSSGQRSKQTKSK